MGDSIVTRLCALAQADPGRVSHAYRSADGAGEPLSVGELDARARSLAAALQDRRLAGERVLLMFSSADALSFVTAFYACLYAGATAVPLPPPRFRNRTTRGRERLDAVLARCRPSAILTSREIAASAARLAEAMPSLRGLPMIDATAIERGRADDWSMPPVDDAALAYLQFTSGSTDAPKGVMVSHGDLVTHSARSGKLMQYGDAATSVVWLPLVHDWGLIDGVIDPVFFGVSCHLLSPEVFIQQPVQWLRAVSEVGATHSHGPNFAYELCARKIGDDEIGAIDLSRWRCAVIAAETIREETLGRFARRFARCGFRRAAFRTAYGMAEVVLIATADVTGGEPRFAHLDPSAFRERRIVAATEETKAVAVASCGTLLVGGKVAIVDPATSAALSDDTIGEVWLPAAGAAHGYWDDEAATQATFRATLRSGEGPFLRTGDLGFTRGPELFITGRLKELIIIGGLNHYPQDIERTVQLCSTALAPNGGAAFSIDEGGEERLVVVHEVVRQNAASIEEIAAAVRCAVAEEHGLELHALVLLPPGRLFKTTSGKIARMRCRDAFLGGTLPELGRWARPRTEGAAAADAPVDRREVAAWLVRRVAEHCGIAPAEVDRRAPFAAFGISSREAVIISGDLARVAGRRLPPSLLYDAPTIDAVVEMLAGGSGIEGAEVPVALQEPIAVIGAACRFPGADTFDEFSMLLANGVDAVGEAPAARAAAFARRGGWIEGVDCFDAAPFRMSPAEARSTDPQHRMLLETVWQALEHAGIACDALDRQPVGVFIGLSGSDYQRLLLHRAAADDPRAAGGMAPSMAAGRLGYVFGLRGPAMTIDTSCSSSLVAVHTACQSLRAGECTLAVVGGANALLDPEVWTRLAAAGMLSGSGACHTFDAAADGYVRGEGCGVAVLKRLADALRDGDRIVAVIRGSAVNQDGRTNGLTAPSMEAQQEVVRTALRAAAIAPSDVGYVEAHGSGTQLGDAIELHALGAVFAGRSADAPLLVGSVKANIGHLEASAGIAGLLKVVSALHCERIPPHLGMKVPTPHVWWGDLPLTVPLQPVPWRRGARRRIAGVSSFGFSGTNAHVVVEEAPERRADDDGERSGDMQLLTISAATPSALEALARRYRSFLGGSDAPALADVCHTAAVARAALPFRASFCAASADEMCEALARAAAPRVAAAAGAEVAFAFTGQAPFRPLVTCELLRTQTVFRETLQRCDELLRWPRSLASLLEDPACAAELTGPDYAQPLLFAIEVALAALWRACGVEPALVVGHGAGELAAATVAQAMTLEEGLGLSVVQGRAFAQSPSGAMILVFASEDAVAPLLDGGPVIVAKNAPGNTVVAGPAEAIEASTARLRAAGLDVTRLPVAHAFHIPAMSGAADEVQRAAASIDFRPLRVPLVSSVTGELIAAGSRLDAVHWREHAWRGTDFIAAARRVLAHGMPVVEIGPSATLTALMAQIAPEASGGCFASLGGPAAFLRTAGALWERGAPVALRKIVARGRRVTIPSYPFERRRYWMDDADPIPMHRIAREDAPGWTLTLLAATLGCAEGEVAGDAVLTSLGIDSLAAIRIRSAIEAATGVSVPFTEMLDGMTPRRLAATIGERMTTSGGTPAAVAPNPAEASAPLSFAQLRLWVLEQLDPGNAAYNLPTTIRLHGALDTAALARALGEIVRRHGVLRARFAGGEEPLQVVEPAAALALRVRPVSGDAELERLIREDARAPFDLQQPPMLRATLYGISAEEHVLGLTFHHIVADGWSLAVVLMRELSVLYGAFLAGGASPLPPAPQYAGFARQQRDSSTPEALRDDLRFWEAALTGAPPPLAPPGDRRPAATRSLRGTRIGRVFPRVTLDAAKAFARRNETTLFTVLAAALAAALHRWTEQDDIVIGTSVTSRSAETADVFGDFTNFVPLRMRVIGEASALALLRATRETVLAALAHARCPFEQIVNVAGAPRDPRRNPLYDVALAVHTFSHGSSTTPLGPSVTASFIPPLAQVDNGSAELGLIFEAAENDDGLAVDCEAAEDLFDPAGAARLLRQYELLLAAMCADPELAVDRLPMTDADPAAPIAPLPRARLHASLIDAFHDAAERHAQRIALRWDGGEMSYAELRARAHGVSLGLAAAGVGVEDRVGIRLTEGPDLIVAMLGVLEAGAAYVPLDPAYPQERLQWQATDAGVRVIVSALDETRFPEVPLPRPAGANAAYVIYTSGSTGKPKGVTVTHDNALRLFASTCRAVAPSEDDVWTLFHSFAFDFSVWEIWGALLHGGRLVIVPPATRRDPDALLDLLGRERVTVLNQTPSAFRGLMRAALTRGAVPESLRMVIFGGEALDPLSLAGWLDAFGDERPLLVNMYGITETTVHVTWRPLRREDVLERRTSVIGHPLEDLEVLLLDAHGELVPPGVAGEIHVGGAGLARGYLGQPGLTAERFVPHPLRRGERLYRSGDVGRLTGLGELEYLGRIDQQVKVRGYRIEPAEVEAVLRDDPRVRDCVVRAIDSTLVAWVVPTESDDGACDQIAQWKSVFDGVYGSTVEPSDPSLNTAGWNSSYTRAPIPAEEMREWAAQTVDAILALQPRRLFEIGCGTGMLLQRIAPHCDRYLASDVSAAAIAYLERVGVPASVELMERGADDFTELEPESFDAVVINSVVQLFPSVEYLAGVLAGAARLVRRGGFLFVGDVRNHRLLAAFHRSLLAHEGIDEAGERLEARMRGEQELTVAPELFGALARLIPRLAAADVQVKRTAQRNEMSRFRYDVVLRLDDEQRAAPAHAFAPWRSLDELASRLAGGEPLVALSGIPNARIAGDAAAVDPAALIRLGETLGYSVRIRFTPFADDGRMDALFVAGGEPLAFPPVECSGALDEYANAPSRAAAVARLTTSLRTRLQSVLPPYMVPSSVIAVPALPVGSTGKLDIDRLPWRERERPMASAALLPRNAVEAAVAAIWREVLGGSEIGVLDNFFQLGGHSLQAAQVVARVRAAFGCELSLRAFFEAPTVAGTSEQVSRRLPARDFGPGEVHAAH